MKYFTSTSVQVNANLPTICISSEVLSLGYGPLLAGLIGEVIAALLLSQRLFPGSAYTNLNNITTYNSLRGYLTGVDWLKAIHRPALVPASKQWAYVRGLATLMCAEVDPKVGLISTPKNLDIVASAVDRDIEDGRRQMMANWKRGLRVKDLLAQTIRAELKDGWAIFSDIAPAIYSVFQRVRGDRTNSCSFMLDVHEICDVADALGYCGSTMQCLNNIRTAKQDAVTNEEDRDDENEEEESDDLSTKDEDPFLIPLPTSDPYSGRS